MAKKRKSSKEMSGLTGEDAELWSRVAGSVEPLSERDVPIARQQSKPPAGRPQSQDTPEGGGGHKPPSAPPATAKPPARHTAPLGRIDRRESRQIAGGRVTVDARIDLHGHRQREAYGALKAFLMRAQAAGHRYVLVITGKGAVRAQDDAVPFYETSETGVLKRAVPRWLSEPAFRELIVSYGPAHARHGGEGALYIRLRRERR